MRRARSTWPVGWSEKRGRTHTDSVLQDQVLIAVGCKRQDKQRVWRRGRGIPSQITKGREIKRDVVRRVREPKTRGRSEEEAF